MIRTCQTGNEFITNSSKLGATEFLQQFHSVKTGLPGADDSRVRRTIERQFQIWYCQNLRNLISGLPKMRPNLGSHSEVIPPRGYCFLSVTAEQVLGSSAERFVSKEVINLSDCN